MESARRTFDRRPKRSSATSIREFRGKIGRLFHLAQIRMSPSLQTTEELIHDAVDHQSLRWPAIPSLLFCRTKTDNTIGLALISMARNF